MDKKEFFEPIIKVVELEEQVILDNSNGSGSSEENEDDL